MDNHYFVELNRLIRFGFHYYISLVQKSFILFLGTNISFYPCQFKFTFLFFLIFLFPFGISIEFPLYIGISFILIFFFLLSSSVNMCKVSSWVFLDKVFTSVILMAIYLFYTFFFLFFHSTLFYLEGRN